MKRNYWGMTYKRWNVDGVRHVKFFNDVKKTAEHYNVGVSIEKKKLWVNCNQYSNETE